MEKRQLGRSGLKVTVLTMGCWQAGGSGWSGIDDDESVAAIRAALDAGVNFFDTAEAYGEGHSEQIVAKALDGRRDDVYIATKVWAANLATDKLNEACSASLKHLNTDHIDLYQIHWPAGTWNTPMTPIEETMGALEKLKAQGKIGAIGVSNFNKAQVAQALEFGRVDSLQPPYSLFWRRYEEDGTTAFCKENDIGILAYSPQAQGLLTGKFNKDNRPTDDNRKGNLLFNDPHYEKALQAVEQLKPLAAKYGVSTGQLTLQWLLGQPGMTSAIVGARTPDQATDNAKAANIAINDVDRALIEQIGRTVTAGLGDQSSMWG